MNLEMPRRRPAGTSAPPYFIRAHSPQTQSPCLDLFPKCFPPVTGHRSIRFLVIRFPDFSGHPFLGEGRVEREGERSPKSQESAYLVRNLSALPTFLRPVKTTAILLLSDMGADGSIKHWPDHFLLVLMIHNGTLVPNDTDSKYFGVKNVLDKLVIVVHYCLPPPPKIA